jgi:hypothetical protein
MALHNNNIYIATDVKIAAGIPHCLFIARTLYKDQKTNVQKSQYIYMALNGKFQ